MTLLLDTHSFLWFWWDAPHLSEPADSRRIVRQVPDEFLCRSDGCGVQGVGGKLKVNRGDIATLYEYDVTHSKVVNLNPSAPLRACPESLEGINSVKGLALRFFAPLLMNKSVVRTAHATLLFLRSPMSTLRALGYSESHSWEVTL